MHGKKGVSMRLAWVAAIMGIALLTGQAFAEGQTVLKSEKEKISYIIGVNIGRNLKAQSVDVDPDIVSKGLKDVASGGKLLLTDDEMKETMTAFQQEMMKKREEEMKKVGEKNKAEGEAFLAANKKKPGVVTLPSGLQYKVITEGKGKTPKATDVVTVNYKGTLIDGTEFDSSYKHGEPVTFPVNGVIPGWTEALQLMKEGSKWEIYIPSNLAYGERGAGKVVGPDATLIFEVELLSVKEGEAANHGTKPPAHPGK
jgi:FKBP-type peptidyl-prolyl cis-trans isomerase FklB